MHCTLPGTACPGRTAANFAPTNPRNVACRDAPRTSERNKPAGNRGNIAFRSSIQHPRCLLCPPEHMCPSRYRTACTGIRMCTCVCTTFSVAMRLNWRKTAWHLWMRPRGGKHQRRSTQTRTMNYNFPPTLPLRRSGVSSSVVLTDGVSWVYGRFLLWYKYINTAVVEIWFVILPPIFLLIWVFGKSLFF